MVFEAKKCARQASSRMQRRGRSCGKHTLETERKSEKLVARHVKGHNCEAIEMSGEKTEIPNKKQRRRWSSEENNGKGWKA